MTDAAVETLFLSTIPGATPSNWVQRFTTRGANVQLVTQDEQSQTLFLQPHDPPRHLPQLGYLRWRADATWQDLVATHQLDPDAIHLVRLYHEKPVVLVSKDHLLAAPWPTHWRAPIRSAPENAWPSNWLPPGRATHYYRLQWRACSDKKMSSSNPPIFIRAGMLAWPGAKLQTRI